MGVTILAALLCVVGSGPSLSFAGGATDLYFGTEGTPQGPPARPVRIVAAIGAGHLTPDEPMPSSRVLAEQLGIARNTVVAAYAQLADDGVPVGLVGAHVGLADVALAHVRLVPSQVDGRSWWRHGRDDARVHVCGTLAKSAPGGRGRRA